MNLIAIKDDYETVDNPEKALELQWAHSLSQKRKEKYEKPKHTKNNPVFRLCFEITNSSTFNLLFILITVANTVVLASVYRGISE